MRIEAPFKIHYTAHEQIIRLIEKTALGTGGAVYRHLDTRDMIGILDDPVFITLERNENCIANITFCDRNSHWYIRYFVFDQLFQSRKKGNKPSSSRNFKSKIANLFQQELLSGKTSFYAYIEPQNKRSQWMRENFGFATAGQLQTQSFSRLHPKADAQLEEITVAGEQETLLDCFQHEAFFTKYNTGRTRFFVLRTSENEILASCRVQAANWKIERMSGRFGKTFVSVLPYLPYVNRLLQVENFSFLVADAVYVKEDEAKTLERLFESVLAVHDKKVLFWWTDQKNPVLKRVQSIVKWGLLNRIMGRPRIDVVVKSKDPEFLNELKQQPFFVNGMDLI